MRGDRIGEFEELILLSVKLDAEQASGVQIQESLEEIAGRTVSLGAIYAALERLERKQLVTSWLGDPTPVRGGRRKRHYALTDAGLAAVQEARRVREALWSGIREAKP
jgi:DNA-binding PadR family transcriptional regulator